MHPDISVSLHEFTLTANILLGGRITAMYAYGSAVQDDFHPGVSDLDFLCIADGILPGDFDMLHRLYTQYREDEDPHLSVLEGEFMDVHALYMPLDTVYWGTSGDRLKQGASLRPFDLLDLHANGVLLYGRDVRGVMPRPTREELNAQVAHLIATVREHGGDRPASVHNCEWLMLISKALYWLDTGMVAGKSRAANWVVETYAPKWQPQLQMAMGLRKNPEYARHEDVQYWLSHLGGVNMQACDLLETIFTHKQEVKA